MEEFLLEGSEYVDLCDLMKLVGFAPNGAVAKHIIATGVVKVDGKIETRKRCKIRSGQEIEYQGKKAKVR